MKVFGKLVSPYDHELVPPGTAVSRTHNKPVKKNQMVILTLLPVSLVFFDDKAFIVIQKLR